MSNPADHQAILRTLAYYDVFDVPLTGEELWRWLFPPEGVTVNLKDLPELEAAAETMVQAGQIERHDGYLTLPGREAIVAVRTARLLDNRKKWKRAESTARFLELVPFVRMIAVVNSLAIDNARPDSDIDLLIVTAPGHLWIARLIVTGIVSLLGYRRSGGRDTTNIANRVCLSFYLTTNALDLELLKRQADDPHFAFWTAQAVPLVDDGTYEKYQTANGWVTKLLPHAWEWDWRARRLAPNAGLRAIKQFYELFFNTPIGLWIETWARQRQLKRMSGDTASRSRQPDTDVVISDDVLKFHEQDRRLEYREKFRTRLAELGVSP